MSWKRGKVRFDDGSEYDAELLVHNGEVWNMKIHKDGKVIQQIDADKFASELGTTPEKIYPFTYELMIKGGWRQVCRQPIVFKTLLLILYHSLL